MAEGMNLATGLFSAVGMRNLLNQATQHLAAAAEPTDTVQAIANPAGETTDSGSGPRSNIDVAAAGSPNLINAYMISRDFAQKSGSSHLAAGLQTVAAEEDDERGDDAFDPLSEVRSQEFFTIQRQLAQLDPASPYAASIAAPGWTPTERDLYQIDEALNEKIDEIASEIASGHASGRTTDYAFEAMINATIRNPTKSGALRDGRSYYYDQSDNFIVIVDPGGGDSGTAFHPGRGASYLNTLE